MPPPSTAAVGDLPIPSLVLDGDVTLRCDDIRLAAPNTVDVPALAVLGGTLCTDMLWLSNGMLVNAGGTLSVQGSVQELKRAVFRGGTTLLGAAEQKAEFILSGGTAHLADGLAEGSTVEGGAGVFSAQSFSGAAVNDYGAVLWDGADGSAYRGVYGAGYYPTDYSPDWAGTVPSAVWDALNAENPYENDWFAGTLTLENTHAPELLPWGGARHGPALHGRRFARRRRAERVELGQRPRAPPRRAGRHERPLRRAAHGQQCRGEGHAARGERQPNGGR